MREGGSGEGKERGTTWSISLFFFSTHKKISPSLKYARMHQCRPQSPPNPWVVTGAPEGVGWGWVVTGGRVWVPHPTPSLQSPPNLSPPNPTPHPSSSHQTFTHLCQTAPLPLEGSHPEGSQSRGTPHQRTADGCGGTC